MTTRRRWLLGAAALTTGLNAGVYFGWATGVMPGLANASDHTFVETMNEINGVIVNPGAWGHYSWAIHDALELFTAPVVEVHLSNIDEREEWRRFSVLADVVAARFIGKGPDGYREAIEYLAEAQQ
jgi:3-dehydroquinate dehydratase